MKEWIGFAVVSSAMIVIMAMLYSIIIPPISGGTYVEASEFIIQDKDKRDSADIFFMGKVMMPMTDIDYRIEATNEKYGEAVFDR